MLKNNQVALISFILICLIIITSVKMAVDKNTVHFTPIPSNLSTYSMIFDDEFNGNKLNNAKWGTCYDWYDKAADGCSNYGNSELEWYKNYQVGVADGVLSLTAIDKAIKGVDSKNNPKMYQYTSGMVSTGSGNASKARWMNQYGYYEARINSPEGKGLWPAFWLLPKGTSWPPEIDIMEVIGDKPKQILSTYFWRDSPAHVGKDSFTLNGAANFTNSWHTYGVDWEPGRLEWYVDGSKIKSVQSKYVPSQPMSIVLNLAVGGSLPGSPDGKTRFPATMQVDYVRVYKSSVVK